MSEDERSPGFCRERVARRILVRMRQLALLVIASFLFSLLAAPAPRASAAAQVATVVDCTAPTVTATLAPATLKVRWACAEDDEGKAKADLAYYETKWGAPVVACALNTVIASYAAGAASPGMDPKSQAELARRAAVGQA